MGTCEPVARKAARCYALNCGWSSGTHASQSEADAELARHTQEKHLS